MFGVSDIVHEPNLPSDPCDAEVLEKLRHLAEVFLPQILTPKINFLGLKV